MSSKDLKLFTIIVTYKGLHNNWMHNSITSVKNSSYNSKIIVVDNNSPDATVQYIKEQFPKVILIENNDNAGFGKANNQGIALALKNGADYVFLLNQDAYVLVDTFEKILQTAEQNLDYGIISPVHLNGNGESVESDFLNFASPPNTPLLFNDLLLGKNSKNLHDTKFVNAAAWLVSKKCLEIVGGFSPTFYHYGEDNNFCHRTIYHNLKIGIDKNAFILHDRDEMPAHFADLGERSVKDQIVGWANPLSAEEESSPSNTKLIINAVFQTLKTGNIRHIKTTKKLIIYKIKYFKELKEYKTISKGPHKYKYLDFSKSDAL